MKMKTNFNNLPVPVLAETDLHSKSVGSREARESITTDVPYSRSLNGGSGTLAAGNSISAESAEPAGEAPAPTGFKDSADCDRRGTMAPSQSELLSERLTSVATRRRNNSAGILSTFALSILLSLKAEGATSVGTKHAEGDLLRRIAAIESSGNPAAIGDNGKAQGLYQMHAGTWSDACKRIGVKWSFAEATNATKSTIVAGDCVNHLSTRFKSATGRAPNMGEVYAMWNLGFDGFKKRGFNIDKCPSITRRAISKISAEEHITPAKPASFQRHLTTADGSVIHLAEPSGPVSFRGR